MGRDPPPVEGGRSKEKKEFSSKYSCFTARAVKEDLRI